MKIRTLEWDHYPLKERWFSSDMDNQVLYDISRSFDAELCVPVYSLKFFHGYIHDSVANVIGNFFTPDSAMELAQQHFEQFVKEKFFVQDS